MGRTTSGGGLSPAEQAALRKAVRLARRGEGSVEPNPMVGCVLLRDGKEIGTGWHRRFGAAHAEADALSRCADADGITLVVTLEPCNHHGKTPPCTELLIRRGVRRVVAGCTDPNPAVAGGGLTALRSAGLEVVDAGDRACRDLIRPFAKLLRTGMPWVIAKWAMTLDGRIATAGGESQWITGAAARAEVHRLRGRVDAIMVGIGTALADNPLLTARPPGQRVALRVICDSQCRLPMDSRLVQSAREVPVLVACSAGACAAGAGAGRASALRSAGVEVLLLEAESSGERMTGLLRELGRRGLTNVLAEGGAGVLGVLAEMDAIDEVQCHLAPIVVGGRSALGPVGGAGVARLADALRLEGGECRKKGEDWVFRAWRRAD